MIKTAQNLKGFRDFLPADAIIRQRAAAILIKVFESYGFEPLETPALEYADTLLGKYGKEADKLVYTFQDRGKRQVGLRYDLTVPVSRILAQYSKNIPLPFKRYQIQPVWRAEKPQMGRYREFIQCDVDSFGSSSLLADAEIIAVIYQSLKALKFSGFTIKINTRKIIFSLIGQLKISDREKQLSIIRAIDKLSKKSREEIEEELSRAELGTEEIKRLFQAINTARPDDNLFRLFKYLDWLGVDKNYYCFDPTMVRGLDYYTGFIFETIVEKPKIGSVTGGGRYDNLVAQLGGPDIPATGTTIGLDRICDVIRQQNLWPEVSRTTTEILVTIFSEDLAEKSALLSEKLRRAGFNTCLYLNPNDRLDKQLKYANKRGIPYVVICGPEEIAKDCFKIKNMESREQREISWSETDKLRELLK